MQILKVKNQADFDTAGVKEGTLLVFPERQPNGSYVWKYKDSDGNTGSLGSAPAETSGIVCAAGAGVTAGVLVYLADVAGTLTCLPAGLSSHAADACAVVLSGGNAVLAQSGIVTLETGIDADSELFLGNGGDFSAVPPTVSGEIVQKVGRVIDADTVLLNIQPGRIII
jgi:hypothetical protein